MRWTKRIEPPAIAALAALVVLAALCATGCVIPDRPPYAASQSTAVFTNAVWAQDEAGKWWLVSADWDFEPEMKPADIRYQYREGKVLTPGWYAEILKRLKEKP